MEDRVFAVKRCRLSSPEPKRSSTSGDDETREKAEGAEPGEIVGILLTDLPPDGEILNDQGPCEHHRSNQVKVPKEYISHGYIILDIRILG